MILPSQPHKINVSRPKGVNQVSKPNGQEGHLGPHTVTVSQKPPSALSAKNTPEINLSQNKLSTLERLELMIWKLLSTILEPVDTYKFQSLLEGQYGGDDFRLKEYKECVDELLSHHVKGSKEFLAAVLLKYHNNGDDQKLIARSEAGLGQLAYLLASDPRTRHLFVGAKFLPKNQFNAIDSAVQNKQKHEAFQKSHENLNPTLRDIGKAIISAATNTPEVIDNTLPEGYQHMAYNGDDKS